MSESTLFGELTRLMTYDQAAEVLGVAVPTLYEWIRDGRMPPPKKFGHVTRFDPKVVAKVVAEGLSLPGTHREYVPRDRTAERRRARRRKGRPGK